MSLLSAVMAGAVSLLLIGLFVRAADSGAGWSYRVVQYVYYRFASLETYQKTGMRFDGAAAAIATAGQPRLGALVGKVAPSQVGWFSSRFPTDKGSYHDYLTTYDALFAPYRERPGIWILEVGVKKGGSLVLWREVFDESAFVYGIDINPDVPTFARDGHMKVLILDSRERPMVDAALRGLQFDIIIDDGLHEPEAQRQTYVALHRYLRPTGVYVIEDVYEIDANRYAVDGVDVATYPDKSGQSLVVLAPPESIVRETDIWLSGRAAPHR